MTASEFYKVSDQEIRDITALGFVWDHTPPPSADFFIMDCPEFNSSRGYYQLDRSANPEMKLNSGMAITVWVT